MLLTFEMMKGMNDLLARKSASSLAGDLVLNPRNLDLQKNNSRLKFLVLVLIWTDYQVLCKIVTDLLYLFSNINSL